MPHGQNHMKTPWRHHRIPWSLHEQEFFTWNPWNLHGKIHVCFSQWNSMGYKTGTPNLQDRVERQTNEGDQEKAETLTVV